MSYPHGPGYKRQGTSSEAAQEMALRAEILRRRVVVLLQEVGYTGISADEAAAQLEESVLSIRPRFSELYADSWIEETGRYTRNRSGRRANIWRLKVGPLPKRGKPPTPKLPGKPPKPKRRKPPKPKPPSDQGELFQ